MNPAPSTNLDDLGSQYHATRVLMQLLVDAIKLDLPCLVWEVCSDATLIAHCEPSDPAAQRDAFYAWVHYLGIPNAFETDINGATHLYAWQSDFQACTILLTSELDGAAQEDIALAA